MQKIAILILILSIACTGSRKKVYEIPLTGFIKSQGIKLYYEVQGSGSDTLVFLHGTPSTMYAFLKDFDFLYEDFTIIFYDQRGGGRSSTVLAPDSLTWQVNVEDLEALRKHFDISKMNILGVSWGSALGTLYTSKYPENVNKLILSPMRIRKNLVQLKNAEALPQLFDSLTQRRVNEIRSNWEEAEFPKKLCDEYWGIILPLMLKDTTLIANYRGDFCNEPVEKIRNTWKVSSAKMGSLGDYDFCPILQQINNPTLIFKGDFSRTMYREWILEWGDCLPGSNFVWIKDAGYFPWIEQPEVLKNELVTFMNN